MLSMVRRTADWLEVRFDIQRLAAICAAVLLMYAVLIFLVCMPISVLAGTIAEEGFYPIWFGVTFSGLGICLSWRKER